LDPSTQCPLVHEISKIEIGRNDDRKTRYGGIAQRQLSNKVKRCEREQSSPT
jgi:hypothetical protein